MFKTAQQLPPGFDKPTSLPRTPEQSREWQEINRSWWERHPMRYDWSEDLHLAEFSREFYQEIDRRFFAAAEEYLPSKVKPFDRLIPFESLPNWDILEIGVGSGSHAELLSTSAKSFTGIDLTESAVRTTTERMRQIGMNARILQMDAEHMDFPDQAFDFIWSWGVIHHSADTRAVLREMHRVLRPGGQAVVMVYHRQFWEYYLRRGLLRGLMSGQLWRTGSLHRTVQLSTDGGLARYYSSHDWKSLVSEFFRVDQIQVYGMKSHVIPLPGRLRDGLARLIPNSVSRLLTNKLRLGQLLTARMTRLE